ncbi:hypothetical protein BBP40_003594 [Aspergillus hancockii]|nr:hypothetical protein BBP40_003594 [Aspergillus hancockii]
MRSSGVNSQRYAESAYALVEPEVSLFDLHENLVKHNVRDKTQSHNSSTSAAGTCTAPAPSATPTVPSSKPPSAKLPAQGSTSPKTAPTTSRSKPAVTPSGASPSPSCNGSRLAPQRRAVVFRAPCQSDRVGRQAQYELTRRLSEEYGFDFIGAFLVGDPDSRRHAYELIKVFIAEAAERGWGEYRAHLALMDQIARTYNSKDNAQMKLNETLKNAIDPMGVLCPGKNGVWPANYNKEEWSVHKP